MVVITVVEDLVGFCVVEVVAIWVVGLVVGTFTEINGF
jgi:hypothetical protein